MSPLSRWLICTMTALLFLVSHASAHGQDAPPVLPRKPSAVEDRLRQNERRQLDLELERGASPQIALYADVFTGAVDDSGSSAPGRGHPLVISLTDDETMVTVARMKEYAVVRIAGLF